MEFDKITDFDRRDRENHSFAEELLCESKLYDLSEDFLLPDYLPDARKILLVTAEPILTGKFLGRGCLEYEGIVRCRVLYDTDDGRLGSAEPEFRLEGRFESERLDDSCLDWLKPIAENISCRLLSPRKMGFRMKVGASATVWGRDCSLPRLVGADSRKEKEALETLLVPVQAVNLTLAEETDLQESAWLTLEKTVPPIGELLYVTAHIVPASLSGGDTPQINGTLEINGLYTPPAAEGEAPLVLPIRKSVPFSHTMAPIGDRSATPCMPRCTVKQMKTVVSEDADAEKRVLDMEIEYGISLLCATPVELQTVADAYTVSTDRDCLLQSERVPISRVIGHTPGSFSTSLLLPYEELGCKPKTVWAAELQPSFEPSFTLARTGKPVLTGNALLRLAGESEDGSPCSAQISLPLKYEADLYLAAGEGSLLADADAFCHAVRVRPQQDGLSLDFETSLFACFREHTDAEWLREITLVPAPAKAETPGELIFFYADAGERLWDVAKKYRVTRARLAAESEIDREITMGDVLLIPSGNMTDNFT